MLNPSYDIIVAGGGLSGIAAAVAAAREGADVLVIERYGFLGGMATAGLVNPFMPYTLRDADGRCCWDSIVNRGVFGRVLQDLEELGGLHSNRHTFNEELLKLVLDRTVKKHGIHLLLHTFISGVSQEGQLMKGVTVTNKSGTAQYHAKYFVDATGDADLSWLAGYPFHIGREEDGLCQPMTLSFRLAGVDTTRFNIETDKTAVDSIYREYKEKREIRKNPRRNVLMLDHVTEGVIHFNSTRILGKSPVNTEDLTAAEMEAREQAHELYLFMRSHIPGFEHSQLLMTAPQIGVRESRRILGDYTITREDMLSAKKFEDSVARGTYPLDIHNPSGAGTTLLPIPAGDYYTIPYRALIPKGSDNLLVAGRPISGTHEAHSAYRVMPICTCIGEGAGTAAAIAWKTGCSTNQVDIRQLHAVLDAYGALY